LLPGLTESVFIAKDYLYNIFANVLAFYLVAFLSGYLSERLHDVTQTLHERDSDLKNLRALSRDIIESMPSGVFTSDLNGGIITFNDSAQRITGKTSTEVIGKTPKNIFPFLKDVNIRESGKRTEGEIQNKSRIIHIGIRFSTLKNSAGVPTGIIGVFQDLTELKAMEAEIEKKKKWAFIGELSALIAHELRNPLASLKSSVEMLREKKVSGQQADHLMDIALSEMDRLNGIVTDFLLYAKPRQLVKSSFDLHQSLGNVITLLRSLKTEKENVKISKDLKGKLFITGDSKQLQQVFWNLGVNAVEAVSGSGEVIISTEKKNNTLEIRFTDTGGGIGRENIDKIFYPFFTTKDNGTGLGLAIAQRVTEEHGGKITVESRGAGTGATFKVILPVDNVRQEASH
jgi:two-component system sensor histidine kinase PilS (NtrC family)